jgi:DNA repair protein RadC
MTLREQLPPDQRPRERLLQHGANSLTNAELLAIIFGTGTRGINALALAQQLLVRFGGLRSLLSADRVLVFQCSK